VLGRRVEDVFRLADDHPRVPAELVGEARAVDGTVMRRGQIATIEDRPETLVSPLFRLEREALGQYDISAPGRSSSAA